MVRAGKAQNYAIDATYTVSTALQATAWYSRNDTRSDQATCAVNVNVTTGAMTCPTSQAANLRNVGDSFGVGLRGKPMERLELGADFSYSDINDEYRQRALAGAATLIVNHECHFHDAPPHVLYVKILLACAWRSTDLDQAQSRLFQLIGAGF